MTDFLVTSPETGADRSPVLMLAHGAGAAMDSPFMELMSSLLAAQGLTTVRFEFAYMAARRDGGKKRPPPKAEALIPEYERAIAEARARWPERSLLIGGKSMGGRVASMCADTAHSEGLITGLVCLGYPFHPPNHAEKPRTAHLLTLGCPTLIVQGERDPFGTRAEIDAFGLPATITMHWASDGDHDLGPRGGSGFTRKGNLTAAAEAISAFATSRVAV